MAHLLECRVAQTIPCPVQEALQVLFADPTCTAPMAGASWWQSTATEKHLLA